MLNSQMLLKKESEFIYIKSKGKLEKIPDLKKLKKHITLRMKRLSLGNIDFIHSHEILFGKRISLKKYCKCIISNNNIPKSVLLLASKLKIPVKYYTSVTSFGLNNLIGIIEK